MDRTRRGLLGFLLLLSGCAAEDEDTARPRRRPSGPPPWAIPKPRHAVGRIVEVTILQADTGDRWPDLHPQQNGFLRVRVEKGAPDFAGLEDGRKLVLWEADAPNRFRPGDRYEVDLHLDGMSEWKAIGWRYIPPPKPEEPPEPEPEPEGRTEE